MILGEIMQKRLRKILISFSILLALLPVQALALDPIEISGWEGFAGDVQGIRLANDSIGYSSVAAAEIDGVPENGMEVAVGGSDGYLYVYKADGSLHWSVALPNAACDQTGRTNKLYSSPAVGELYNDGVPYVVIGYGGVGGGECGGGVVAHNGITGERRFHFNIKKFDKKNGIWAQQYGVFGAPVLIDINNDGYLEIAFGSFDRAVYLLNARGRLDFRYHTADTTWSSPSFIDIRGNEKLEMIITSDISRNDALGTPDGGLATALKIKKVRNQARLDNRLASIAGARARRLQRRRWRAGKALFGFQSKRVVIWEQAFNQTIMSSPVIADLLPEVAGLEIAFASGCYFPSNSNDKRGKWIKILSAGSGQVVNTLNTVACSPSSLAVGDIDEDGRLELVATVNGDEGVGGDGQSRIAAYNPEDTDPFWSTVPRDKYGNYAMGGHFMSPIIVDVDGNGSLEVLAANSRTVGVYAGKTGLALSCQDGSCGSSVAFRTGSALFATPTVADLNQDGEPELMIGSARNGSGAIFGWTSLASVVSSDAGIHDPFAAPWPTHRGNAHRHAMFAVD